MFAPSLAGWYWVRVAAWLPASQAVSPAVRQAAATTTARRPMGLNGLRLRLTGCSLGAWHGDRNDAQRSGRPGLARRRPAGLAVTRPAVRAAGPGAMRPPRPRCRPGKRAWR